jgi:hypothetical protein
LLSAANALLDGTSGKVRSSLSQLAAGLIVEHQRRGVEQVAALTFDRLAAALPNRQVASSKQFADSECAFRAISQHYRQSLRASVFG